MALCPAYGNRTTVPNLSVPQNIASELRWLVSIITSEYIVESILNHRGNVKKKNSLEFLAFGKVMSQLTTLGNHIPQ